MGKLRQGPLRPGSLWYPHDSAAKSVSTFFPQEARRLILQTPLPLGAELQTGGSAGFGHSLFLPSHLSGARGTGLGPGGRGWGLTLLCDPGQVTALL